MPRVIKWTLISGVLFLAVMTLMRLGLFLFFNRQSHSFQDVIPSFWLGLRFDLRFVSIMMLVMLVLGSIRSLSPFSTRTSSIIWKILLALTAFKLIIFYFIDFAHYAYLSQRLNASVLNYLEDASISLSMVWQSYPVIKILLILAIVGVGLTWILFFVLKKYKKGSTERSAKVRVIWFVGCFVVFSFLIFGRFNQYPLRWSDAFALGDDYKAQLALNPFESFLSTLKYRHSGYNRKKVDEFAPLIEEYFGHRPGTALVKTFPGDGQPKPNVVLVICESFSGYKSSMYGNPLDPTPYFNELAKNGIFFDRCFTPTYGTARGVWAVITGIPDVEIANTASRNAAAVDQHTIINDLVGYEKFYFIGGSASWANIRGVLTNNIHGLHLLEENDFKANRVDVWGISDKNLMLEANSRLAKQTNPFFAIIQTSDNHRPYTIPEEDRKAFISVQLPKDSVTRYGFESNEELNAFRYTDFSFQQFIEAAKKEKYFSNTIFVFVGDHGIAGNAGQMFPQAWTAQRLTSEHVPLLFYAPALLQPARIGRVASQIDVLPTVASLIKVNYSNTTLGRDLLDPQFQDKDFAFIFDPDSRMIGLVNDSFYYRKSFVSKQEELVLVGSKGSVSDSNSKNKMKQLTEAIFETSKYLLLNNKKK